MAVSFLGPAGPSEGLSEVDKNTGEPENTYILRPIFQQRFRPSVVKECIHAVLKEELAGAEYSPDEMPQLTKHLSEMIKDKLKAWLLAVSGMQTQTTTLMMFS
ncbi:dynein light chain Tctex-type protein 2B isoform X2 [Arvicanthis niloticus]|uniref:dynein light chain Tctex-type protein 2B isoform X2 n=1 Tax=Arvicanthis niloticus TaxID=61156 RepID=UPI0014866228|nr:tctex1 domain-containing protein 2 isoform X2 [Arvicanthis niloticus]